MSDHETRSLGRAAVVLFAASLLRFGWSHLRPPPELDTTDGLTPMLEASRLEVEEQRERARPLEEGERLDPNRATARELDRLPGVGPATAQAIVREREEGGPFDSPESLERVRGLGPRSIDRIREHLDLESIPAIGAASREGRRRSRILMSEQVWGRDPADVGRARVNVNRADASELETLPGVGPALAGRIREARREAAFRSVDDLLRVRGIGPATLEKLRALVTVGSR